MRWVKLTLPPRERARWLLTTTRLSMSSLAGTARTLVAVGMVSELSMFETIIAAGPRSLATFSCSDASTSRTAGTSRRVGATSALGRAGAAVDAEDLEGAVFATPVFGGVTVFAAGAGRSGLASTGVGAPFVRVTAGAAGAGEAGAAAGGFGGAALVAAGGR